MIKLKLLMLGLPGSGKTVLANFLSESVDMELNNDVRPTQGARILEFESGKLNINNQTLKADIELWDCSGDHRFESCWPVFRNAVNGVILVCSVNNVVNAPREFELLYNYFVLQPGLEPKQCVVFYNTLDVQQDTKGLRLSPTFAKISQVPVNINEAGNKLRNDFSSYVTTIINSLKVDV